MKRGMVKDCAHVCVSAFEACGIHPAGFSAVGSFIQEASICPASPLWQALHWDPVIHR